MINKSKIVKLKLKRDISKKVKQGSPWIFEDTLSDLPKATPGSIAKLYDKKGKFLAFGLYDYQSSLSFRVITLEDKVPHSELVTNRIKRSLSIRNILNPKLTNAYRLINGEGDLLPGLVVDVFNKFAVLQLDGDGPYGFYDRRLIANFIKDSLSLEGVYFKARHNSNQISEVLAGQIESFKIEFKENNVKFFCDIEKGQKTGFFLDQRDNRNLIGQLSKGLSVCNMFSYTGGFSVYAGLGGATSVTSVDISTPATKNAIENWKLNQLAAPHHAIDKNCFDYACEADQKGERFDLVIVDPPSFAPSQKSVDKAIGAYEKVFTLGLQLCKNEAYFAASSCSSHIDQQLFLKICESAISKARKRAQIIYIGSQGIDHPYPLALQELRYLKFILFKLF